MPKEGYVKHGNQPIGNMKLKIVVATVRGTSIAFSSAPSSGIVGGYYVMELDEPGNLDLGDVLSGGFDWSGYPPFRVRNLTQEQKIQVLVHIDDCHLEKAIEVFLKLVPLNTSIFVSNKRLAFSSEADVAEMRSLLLAELGGQSEGE